jgi:hypothetical protein
MFRSRTVKYVPSGAASLAAILALTVAVAGPSAAGEWKGQVTDKDGVSTIANPAEPMEAPATIKLQENWRIGGDTDAENEFFGVISRITTDKSGNIYLLDSQLNEVMIFAPDGSYVNTIGREGEGPGEFRRPQDMFFLPDGNLGVVQLAPGRIVLLTPDGEPAGDFPLAAVAAGDTRILVGGQLMGDHIALVLQENKMQEGKIDIVRSLAVFDAKGSELKRLHSDTRTIDFANAVMDEKAWSTFDRRWATGMDGAMFAVTQFPDYEIRVWDKDGNPEHVITRAYTHLKRDQAEMDRIKGIFEAFTRQIPNSKVAVSDFDQDIQTLYPRDDGTLWVLSAKGSRKRPQGSLGTFDVFNREGHFVREVTLMGEGDPFQDGYFLVGDRMYVVTGFLDAAIAAQGGGAEDSEDAEAEPMAVICYQLGMLEAGME